MRPVLLILAWGLAVSASTAQPSGSSPARYTDISSGASGVPLSGNVSAVAVGPNGEMYAAGEFSVVADSTRVDAVVQWDGTQWKQLEGVLAGGPSVEVSTLAVAPDGTLYAGGRFTQIGESVVQNVARWNGREWRPLGRGIGPGDPYSRVDALTVTPAGALYAGGDFETAGDASAQNVARWTGTRWEPLGAGVNREVLALALATDGTLYVGGALTFAGNAPASRVARWDGTTWKPLAGPSGTGPDGDVNALAVGTDGSVSVGGRFATAGGVPASRVARWNGTVWSALGAGLPAETNALTVGPGGRLVAGWGDSRNERDGCCLSEWTGSAWQPFGGGANRAVYALVTASDGSVVAGGAFSAAGDTASRSVARWNGTAWRAYGSGFDGIVNALMTGPDGLLYAAGSFRTAGSTKANGIARLTGQGWEAIGSGVGQPEYSSVFTLTFGPDGRLYIGGSFSTAGGVPSRDIASWDGVRWSALGRGLTDTQFVTGVFTLAFGPDGFLYAGGGFFSADDSPAGRIARWDGKRWGALGTAPLGGGVAGSHVSSIVFGHDGSLYAAGSFYSAGGIPANDVARWDGVRWNALGSGIEGTGSAYVSDMDLGDDGALYVTGNFTRAGGQPARNAARWDGTTWSAMGTGLEFSTEDIYVAGGGLIYTGGRITPSGYGRGRIDTWNGTSWQTLAGGPDERVSAVLVDPEGRLVIGGMFLNAGRTRSPFITRLDAGTVASEAPAEAGRTALSLSLAPNPARATATATVSHPAGRATVEVFDTLGRRVVVAFDGMATEAAHAVPLDLGGLAPGVYVVRLTASGGVHAQTLVVGF